MSPSDDLIDSGIDWVNVVMGRADIEAADTSGPLGSLRSLVASPERILHFQGRVALFVDGYNDDSRELYEIPEVRLYVQALDAGFPYWFWFLSTHDHSLALVAQCCCRLSAARPIGSTVARVQFNPLDVAQFLASHFDALNRLAGTLGVEESLIQLVSARVGNYLTT